MATINLGRVGFVNKGAHNIATAYKVNDVVTYNSGTYACIQAHTGQYPTVTSYWQNWVSNDKALDSAVVHKTGDETIAGVKTFTDGVNVQNQNVSPFSGFKNYIINGNFGVWQYGTSQTSYGYGSDDRWSNANNGSTKTHSRVACTDTERALFNASYFSRSVVSSVTGTANFTTKSQRIENITLLSGKTITVSFWAKADSNKNIWLEFRQVFGTGGSPSSLVNGIYGKSIALTNTWQKKSITLTLPSISGKTLGTDGVNTSFIDLQFWFEGGSDYISRMPTIIQQSGTFDIAQVQLEEGSVATPFENRPYGLELSLCQRYFFRPISFLTSVIISTGRCHQSFLNPVKMRVPPTITYSDLAGTVGKVTTTAGNGESFSAGSIYGDADAIRLDAICPTVNSNIAFYVSASAEF